MAGWIPLTLGRAFLEPMEIASSHLLSVADALGTLLITLAKILEIVGLLVMGFANALAAAINALVESIKNFLTDLLSMGFYAWLYAPLPRPMAKRFSEWVVIAAESFDKELDPNRPQFSEDAYVGAVVMCVAFPTLDEVMEWWKSFLELWTSWSFNNKFPVHDDPSEDIQDGAAVKLNPQWRSAALRDVPRLKDYLDTWITALDKFGTNADDVNSVIQNFAKMLKAKGEAIEKFVAYTKATLLKLIRALEQTGAYVLPIYGRGGNRLVQSALRNQSGVPDTITSSAQAGAEKAVQALAETASAIAATKTDDTFVAPQNDMGNWDTTKRMEADLDQHLDMLENDIRMNPQGRLTTLVDKALMTKEQKAAYDARRAAGYPDAADYFQPVPGYDTGGSSSRPPNTISMIVVRNSKDEADSYLKSLTADSDNYPLTNPNQDHLPDATDAADMPFAGMYTIQSETASIPYTVTVNGNDRSEDKPVAIDIVGCYFQGLYENTLAESAEIERVLTAIKDEAHSGAVVIIDTTDVAFTVTPTSATNANFASVVTDFLLKNYWTKASNIIFIAPDAVVADMCTATQTTLDNRRTQSGAVLPGPLGAGDDSAATIMPTVTGSANDVGTRSLGEYLGEELSDALGEKLDDTSVPVPVITYDENGAASVTYKNSPRKQLGPRFEATSYPDFAGLNNWTIGIIVMTGGPSEAPAEALFNLIGISTAAGQTAATAAVKTADVATSGASVFNNFKQNYEYDRAKERLAGNTTGSK